MFLRNALPGHVYYSAEYDAHLLVLETNGDKPSGTVPVIDKDNMTFAFKDERSEVEFVDFAQIVVPSSD